MNNNPLVAIVGTPIGNLGDLSPRAAEALKSADAVYAEDTRTAAALLNYLGIKKRLVSCHKDNERRAAEKILSEAAEGRRIAVISEAGMPCISDPGSEAVKALIRSGTPFEIIGGPTALIHGLIASGFCGGSFYFYGFLPHKASEKRSVAEKLSEIPAPVIFYESPRRAAETITILLEYFRAPIACSRELTKIHEETVFVNSAEDLEKIEFRGEFVITAEGRGKEENCGSLPDARYLAEKLTAAGLSSKDAASAMKILGIKRNEAYRLLSSVKERQTRPERVPED